MYILIFIACFGLSPLPPESPQVPAFKPIPEKIANKNTLNFSLSRVW